MLLGDILSRLDDETLAMQALMELGDIVLLAEVETFAAAEGLTPGAFAARSVDLFSNRASDEDWMSLIGVMGQSADPGRACLRRILRFALRQPKEAAHACGHGH
ncbi:hypothetical protein [Bosea thiooxidans]